MSLTFNSISIRWRVYDALPDPLIGWGGGYPSHIPPPQRLQRLAVDAWCLLLIPQRMVDALTPMQAAKMSLLLIKEARRKDRLINENIRAEHAVKGILQYDCTCGVRASFWGRPDFEDVLLFDCTLSSSTTQFHPVHIQFLPIMRVLSSCHYVCLYTILHILLETN